LRETIIQHKNAKLLRFLGALTVIFHKSFAPFAPLRGIIIQLKNAKLLKFLGALTVIF